MAGELLLGVDGLAKAYGAQRLFAGIGFGLAAGERVALIGPNGSGKTTLLRILAGLEEPDAGTRALRRGTRIGYVAQEPQFAGDRTVAEELEAAADAAPGLDPAERERLLAATFGRAGFIDPGARAATLSGGWRKRLAIARALVAGPDLLLLDEPTNHLDIDGILWLEGLLAAQTRAYLVVSHDRYFLENIAGRVLKLDRAHPRGLLDVAGTYSEFLVRRDELLRAQAVQERSLQNRVRREVDWLRHGAKARTTKALARVQEAERMIAELGELRERNTTATAGIDFAGSGRRSRRLLVARGLGAERGGRRLFDGLDLVLSPGQRLGLLGPNGSGKTTLLGLLDGSLAAEQGEVRRVDGLAVAHFTQGREALDPELRLRQALAPEGGDAVVYQGRPVHVAGWAKRFLFRPEQLEQRLGSLSGGERARVHLAHLMLQPADLLILDEPTNDLDIPTLEVLEETLLEFTGAMVLVTHDRSLLDRVATLVLALDGKGGAQWFADCSQWLAAGKGSGGEGPAAAGEARSPAPPPASRREAQGIRRLTYVERKEWDEMEGRILAAEEALAAGERALHDPAVAADPIALEERHRQSEVARAEVDRLYARWAELEAKQA